jgi:hypothetical protein
MKQHASRLHQRWTFRPAVESLEDRLVLSSPCPFPKGFRGHPHFVSFVATVSEPDGDTDTAYSATVSFGTNLLFSAKVTPSGGLLQISGQAVLPQLGWVPATITIDETEEAGLGHDTVDVNALVKVGPTGQPDYSCPPPGVAVALPNDATARALWTNEALQRASFMALALAAQGFGGPGKASVAIQAIGPDQFAVSVNGTEVFVVTRITRGGGGHTNLKKMDIDTVKVQGAPTYDQLAAAASLAGFWVHAEAVTLVGTFWPPTPGSRPHLDLFLESSALPVFALPSP